MPKELLQQFGKTRVLNKQMQMSFLGAVKSDSSRGGDDFNSKRKGRSGDFRGERGRNERGNDNRGNRTFNEKSNRSFSDKPRRDRRG